LAAILAIARHYQLPLSAFEPKAPPRVAPSEQEHLSRQLAKEAAALPPAFTVALVQFVVSMRTALGEKR
jgi:hypothetical protein